MKSYSFVIITAKLHKELPMEVSSSNCDKKIVDLLALAYLLYITEKAKMRALRFVEFPPKISITETTKSVC